MLVALPDPTLIFSYSYLLGWDHEADVLRLYVDMMVAPSNPYFRPYPRGHVGCYLTSTLVFRGCTVVRGLRSPQHVPKLDPRAQGEFLDVAEFHECTAGSDGAVRFEMDDYVIEVVCREVEFVNTFPWSVEG